MALAGLNPEQGLLLSRCSKLANKDLLEFLLKCENQQFDLKESGITNPRPGDVYLVASTKNDPLKVTEEFISSKPTKTFVPVTFKDSNRKLLKSYYNLGTKPDDATKFNYQNSEFKKQTAILDNRHSNAVIVHYYSNSRVASSNSDQTNSPDQSDDSESRSTSTSTRSAPTRSSTRSAPTGSSTRSAPTRSSTRSAATHPSTSTSNDSDRSSSRSSSRSDSTDCDEIAPIPQVRKPHGNSRLNTNHFTTLSAYQKSAATEFVKNAKSSSRVKIYDNLVNHVVDSNGSASISNLPRNQQQIKYEKSKQVAELILHTDELMAVLCETAIGLDHFVYSMEVYPEVHLVLAHPGAIELARRIIKNSNKKKLPHLLSYDDTYNMTGFYVSILIMRNTELQGDPSFVVCFLVHSKRTKDAHKKLFDHFVTKVLELNEYTCITTDREKAIISAVNESLNSQNLPNNLLFCNLHIVRDVRFWSEKEFKLDIEAVRKKFGSSDEQAAVEQAGQRPSKLEEEEAKKKTDKMQDEIRKLEERYREFTSTALELCRCKTLNDLRKMLSKVSPRWSVKFREYFYNHIEPALENNLLKLNRQELHDFIARPNNNASEAANSSVKKFVGEPNIRLDLLVLLLYRYVSNTLFNFNRAYSCSGGNYSLSDELKNLNSDDLAAYQVFCPYPTTFESQIKELKSDIQDSRKHQATRSVSQFEIAKECLELGLVTMDADSKTFNVQSPYDERNFGAVKFVDNKLLCICPISKVCFHRLAVELLLERDDISLGSFDLDWQKAKKNIEISRSKRYEKGGKKGPARLPPKSIFDKFKVKTRSTATSKATSKATPKAAPKTRSKKAKVDDLRESDPDPEDEILGFAREKEVLTDEEDTDQRSSPMPNASNLSLPSIATCSMFSSVGETEVDDYELVEISEDEEYEKYELLTDRYQVDVSEKERLCKLAVSKRWYEGSLINYYLIELASKDERFFTYHPKLFYHPTQQYLHSLSRLQQTHQILLFPFNTDPTAGKHWCLGVINIQNRAIAILDSMLRSRRSYELFFKKLLVAAILYMKPRDLKSKPDAWKFHLISDAEQQPPEDSWSCGPMMCLYANMAVKGVSRKFSEKFKSEIRDSIQQSDLKEACLYDKATKFKDNLTKKLKRFCKHNSYEKVKSREISKIGIEKFLASL